jgi:hypothetical protein
MLVRAQNKVQKNMAFDGRISACAMDTCSGISCGKSADPVSLHQWEPSFDSADLVCTMDGSMGSTNALISSSRVSVYPLVGAFHGILVKRTVPWNLSESPDPVSPAAREEIAGDRSDRNPL